MLVQLDSVHAAHAPQVFGPHMLHRLEVMTVRVVFVHLPHLLKHLFLVSGAVLVAGVAPCALHGNA